MSEFTISGGPSSIAARLDDMSAWAERLEAVANELNFLIARALADEWGDVGGRVTGAALAPESALAVEAALLEFRIDAARVTAVVTITAEALPLVVAGYRAAEEAASEAFRAILTTGGYGLGVLARNAALLLAFSPAATFALGLGAATVYLGLGEEGRKALGEGALRMIFEGSDGTGTAIDTVLPGFVAGFFGAPHPAIPFPGQPPWPHDTESLARTVVGVGGAFGAFGKGEIEVEELDRQDTRHPEPPADTRELFARTVDQHQGKESGEVRIEEVLGPDGETRWIVYLPATTDWSIGSDNVTDSTTNVRGVAGLDTAMKELVMQAMAEQGIEPGEEVLLTGYSQGGITAGGLASDPEFTSQYNVTAVVTTGSPISGFEIPPDIDVLAVEKEDDLVPDLDGAQNPEEANWTTVTADLSMDDLRDMPMFEGKSDAEIHETISQPGFQHNSGLYDEVWRQVGAGGQDAAFRAEHAGFFAGVVVGSRDYGAQRVPEGRQKPAAKPARGNEAGGGM